MKRHSAIRLLVSGLGAALFVGAALAASPPTLLNYQGVLRDASDNPLSGTYDMTFRLMDGGAGDEILVDDHSGAASGVTVTGGLFSVAIGGGSVTDGAGPGSYTDLAEVFRDYDNVLLRVEVGGETLSPDVRILAAAYAQNAKIFDGLDSGQFLRTDVNDAAFGTVWFAGDPVSPSVADGSVYINPTVADANETLLGIAVSGVERFRVDAEGDLSVGGSFVNLANGAQLWDNGFKLEITAGDADTDDLNLVAGNSGTDGSLLIVGDGLMQLRAGDGNFSFLDGNTSTEVAAIAPNGELQLSGGNLGFFSGAESLHWDTFWDSFSLTDRLVVDSVLTDLLESISDMSVTAFDDQLYFIDYANDSTTDTAGWFRDGSVQIAELNEAGDFRVRGSLTPNGFDVAESFLKVGPLAPGELVSVDPSRADAVRRHTGTRDTVLGVVSTAPALRLGGAPFDEAALAELWGDAVYERFLVTREERRELVLAQRADLQERLRSEDDSGETDEVGADPADLRRRPSVQAEIDKLALELFFEEHFVPVALAGRVPMSVDGRYGDILPGDALAPSPTPGAAMKATEPGIVVGIALEGFSGGRGQVLAFVGRSYWAPSGTPSPVAPASDNVADLPTPTPAPAVPTVLGAPADGAAVTPSPTDPAPQAPHADSATPAGLQRLAVSQPVEVGDVLVLDPERPGSLRPGTAEDIAAVAGIAAGPSIEASAPVAFSGIVPCKVDAGYGSVRVGDLLTVSPTAGHAMRALEALPGTIVGKAAEPLDVGTGTIQVLVTLR